MDPAEVITIEDSPPTTPSRRPQIVPTMQEPQNLEFPVAEHAINWSRSTTNFIKQAMNSAIKQNDLLFTNPNPHTRTFASYNYPSNLPSCVIPNLVHPMFPCYQYPPPKKIYRVLPTRPQLRNGARKKSRGDDTWTETAPYYFDPITQTPIPQTGPFPNYPSNIPQPVAPEFINVDSLNHFITTENSINGQKPVKTVSGVVQLSTNDDQASHTKKIPLGKTSVPLFLKRNRSVLPKMPNAPNLAHFTSITPQNVELSKIPEKEPENDDLDVVFLGEFKKEPTPPVQKNQITIKLPEKAEEKVGQICQEKEEVIPEQKVPVQKRKGKNFCAPRRNPKRQVRIERDYQKVNDGAILDAILEVKRELKVSKVSAVSAKKAVSGARSKVCRRSPRISEACGAIYSPPSPLTKHHIRPWPSEGMHERPEYDPVTGKVHPFDSHIRKIAESYCPETRATLSTTNAASANQLILNKEQSLSELCHEMLHHVCAYVSTVKKLEWDEKERDAAVKNSEKLMFLHNLCLEESKEEEKLEICHMFKEDISQGISELSSPQVKDLNGSSEFENVKSFNLVDLLQNSCLLYCLTNDVKQCSVAKYISTLDPDDIIQMSNEMFQLFPSKKDED